MCMSHYVRIRRALKKQGIEPTNVKNLSEFSHLLQKPVNTRGRLDREVLTRVKEEKYAVLKARADADGSSVYELARTILESWADFAATAAASNPVKKR